MPCLAPCWVVETPFPCVAYLLANACLSSLNFYSNDLNSISVLLDGGKKECKPLHHQMTHGELLGNETFCAISAQVAHTTLYLIELC